MQEKFSEFTLILIGSTAIILMLTGLIVFSLFIDQKRKFRHQQEKSEMKNNFDRELLRSHLEIQAQACESISRELHDNVGTLISIAMVHLKLITANDQAGNQQRLEETDSLLNEAMATLKDISRSLNPENISMIGWQESFAGELERVRKTNLFQVRYAVLGQPFDIALQKQVIIFRILQETLNNAVKHSNGNQIDAEIYFKERSVKISIRDDGKGFEKDLAAETARSSGLKNMRARAAMLPAKLEVNSQRAKGTNVVLTYVE